MGRACLTEEGIKMGFCSAVTLAFATIFSLAAVALLAIAFSTDNWLTIHVNRGEEQDDADREALAQKWLGSTDPESVAKISNSPLYFTRTRGLFRECYPGQKSEAPQSPALDLYMSPVETWCRNLDYYIPDEDGITNNLDAEQMTRIRKLTTCFYSHFYDAFLFRHEPCHGCPFHCRLLLHVCLVHRRSPRMLEDVSLEHHGLCHLDAHRLPLLRGRDGTLARGGTLGTQQDQHRIRH